MYMESLSMYMEVLFPCIWKFTMYMEVFHVYGGFPCIWKFSMYMEVFHVYGEFVHVYGGFVSMYMEVYHVYGSFPCIWKFFMYMELSMYMEVLHPCIWKFSMYIESISMYMEEIFLLFQDGVSRVWNDLPSARMSCFFLLQEI